MQKLYCYVDESGQDTGGKFFIVSVVVTDHERDQMTEVCEQIEIASGKRRRKWIKADHAKRIEYIQRIFREPDFSGKLNVATYQNSKEYLSPTVLTIARAILFRGESDYKATILIGGLPRAHEKWIGNELRHLRISVRKVRGTRTDDNDALIRLADAVCGLVRGAIESSTEMQGLVDLAKSSGLLKEL
jgi:hypothetical protein